MRRKFTIEEQKLYQDNLRYAEPKEIFLSLWWSFVSLKKFFVLIDGLNAGKTWRRSIMEAKELK